MTVFSIVSVRFYNVNHKMFGNTDGILPMMVTMVIKLPVDHDSVKCSLILRNAKVICGGGFRDSLGLKLSNKWR